MRAETDKAKLESFMTTLGQRVRGEGRIYLMEFCQAEPRDDEEK